MNKYFNRELSWLEFNKRVLNESMNQENSLKEQLNFLSIFSSNLDEFFMVRVGSLLNQNKNIIRDISGFTPKEQIKKINEIAKKIINIQYKRYNKLKKKLKRKNIKFTNYKKLSLKSKKNIDKYFFKNIYPIISPIVVDDYKNLPLIKNKSINLFLILKLNNNIQYGNIQIPDRIPRIIEINNNKNKEIIFVENLIRNKLKNIYKLYQIKEIITYRITRNAYLNYNEENVGDLLIKVSNLIKKRKFGKIVRVEIEKKISLKAKKIFEKIFLIKNKEFYLIKSELDLRFLNIFKCKKNNIFKCKNFEEIKKSSFEKIINKNSSEKFFEWIDKKDRIYHLPYDDFSIVLKFIKLAINDKNVIAIKQTLYRVNENSLIIDALESAAKKGKNVTVLLELKARFDEENNIKLSKKLKKAGVNVIYGHKNFKTHAKILIIIKKNKENKIKTYCHFSTGNYNEKTAKIYEDIGFFTSNEKIGKESIEFFNFLSFKNNINNFKFLKISPLGVRDYFEKMINYEIKEAKKGKKAIIFCKMNSLTDKRISDKFYKASKFNVNINLIIRGICVLIPQKNIKIKSIIGKFLEHSRIYYFYHGGKEKIFIASLDFMERNFDKRIEILIELKNEYIKNYVFNILSISWKDTKRSYFLKKNGKYFKKKKNEGLDVQNYFLKIRRKIK